MGGAQTDLIEWAIDRALTARSCRWVDVENMPAVVVLLFLTLTLCLGAAECVGRCDTTAEQLQGSGKPPGDGEHAHTEIKLCDKEVMCVRNYTIHTLRICTVSQPAYREVFPMHWSLHAGYGPVLETQARLLIIAACIIKLTGSIYRSTYTTPVPLNSLKKNIWGCGNSFQYLTPHSCRILLILNCVVRIPAHVYQQFCLWGP